jgi:hypothetical protein
MTEAEKEYFKKINQVLSQLQEINEGFTLSINKHGEIIEEIANVMLPTLNEAKGKDLKAATVGGIIGSYEDLMNMYVKQNSQATLLLTKQLETTNDLNEFLNNKIMD